MEQNEFPDYDKQIELILQEANSYNLRWEVETYAKHYLDENPTMDVVLAYECAFQDWVK